MSQTLVRGGRAVAPLVAILSLLVATWPAVAALDPPAVEAEAAGEGGHLLISELQTGGASASDEFVELYNPTEVALPLEGLELVYVTASGSTVTRKAAWELGAPGVEPGRHLLVANEAGIHAAIGDLTYASGVAATGGAWALRIQGASTAIDAVGWGAASAWLESRPATAPGVGASVERLPGGALGSTQDNDDNLVDFAIRDLPDPQNLAAAPVPDPAAPSPTPTPLVSPPGSPTATPTATSTPTPTPSDPSITIAAARALPEGAVVTVRGATLTDGAFAEGGGYLADATGGIAVLLDVGTFPRGQQIVVSGELDDRYGQRTVRATLDDVTVLGPAVDPTPLATLTASVGEAVEGQLVAIGGSVTGSPTDLSGGLAVDIDDGSGPVRVFVGTATGIDIGAWEVGAHVSLHGVVGQRDSTGSGTGGYRVQPRDAGDVIGVEPPVVATPTPSASPMGSPTASQSAAPSTSPPPSGGSAPPLVTIAEARASATNARVRVRGVVTIASGMVEPGSAVVQDGSAAILVRLGGTAASLARGDLVELSGTRSTKSGMLTLRVTEPAVWLGRQADPAAARVATGAAGEAHEAMLVVVRGAVAGRTSRLSAGGVSFEIDDGSGPLRVVYAGRAGLGEAPTIGTWIEVQGALGQETSGAQPQRGYRVWPRARDDVVLVAAAGTAGGAAGTGAGEAAPPDPDADPIAPALGGQGSSTSGEPGRIPTLAGGAGTSAAGSSAVGARARAGDDSTRGRAPAGGLVLIGLAGLLAAGTTAWRTGLIARLRRSTDATDGPGGDGTGEGDRDDEVPLTRLAVVRGSGTDPT